MPAETQSWPKIGNEKAVEFLSRVVSGGQVAQTYIFIGPDDLGKSTIALAFAKNLMASALAGREGTNSDLHILKREDGKKSISIDQVRELIKDLSLGSFLDSYKIGLIKEADALTPEAQNALLKTLEEPRDKVVIILLAESEESLLPTIISRAQKLYFQAVPAETIYDYLITEYGAQRSLAKDLANISLGRPLKAVRFFENEDLYAAYLEKARICLPFLNSTVNARLKALDKLFNDRTYSAAAVAGADEIIGILESLWRDLLLLNLNQPEKIQHSALRPELDKTLAELNNFSPTYLLERFKLTAQAREYLAASVNPRVVLEQLAINLWLNIWPLSQI